MEERKIEEIEYYEKRAKECLNKGEMYQGDFEGFNPSLLSSYSYFYKLIKKYCQKGRVLDYGCGNGIHSSFIAKQGAEVIGIDLSESSLEIARKRAKKEGLDIKFLKMDCENMGFEDNYFDVIVNGGTFSSLDLGKAIPEIKRILRPNGALIGIETFGHNPFGNFKRKLNERSGKRTKWATAHILKKKDIDNLKKEFKSVDVRYFHVFSAPFIPFLEVPLMKPIFKGIDIIDTLILKIPFIRKYAFKVVITLSEPI